MNNYANSLAMIGQIPTNYGLAGGQTLSSINGGLQMPDINPINNQMQSLGLNQASAGTGFNFGGINPTANQAGGLGNLTSGLGMNMPTLQLGLQGLGALGNLYMGSKAMGLAKDQFNFTKDVTNANLNNSIGAYNTALEGRLRTREQFNTGESGDAWKSDFERLKATR